MRIFLMLVLAAASGLAAQRGGSGSGHSSRSGVTVRSTNQSRATAAPVQRFTASPVSRTSAVTRVVVINNGGRGYYGSRFWWGGGLYFGAFYGPGWYYPAYPFGYGYGYGYQFGFAPYANSPGIKFNLDEIAKDDRKAVEEAGVYLPDREGKPGYLGSVKDFSGNLRRALPLRPGTYDLTVALADGRQIDMAVTVQPQRVTHVALRVDSASSGNESHKLTPAPPPNAATPSVGAAPNGK